MKKIAAIMMSMVVLSFAGNVIAGKKTTKADAEAMVNKAVAFVKEKGVDNALAEFNNPKGQFCDGELYVFAYDFQGTNKALPTKPELVGKNLINLKDADGKLVIKDLIGVAKKGGGWHQYKWENPATNKIADKASYVVKVNEDLWLGCGIYLQ